MHKSKKAIIFATFYFFDPNGLLLEFAATVRQLGDPQRDLQHHTPSSV